MRPPQGTDFSINVDAIREQLQRLAMPGQKIEIVTGLHELQVYMYMRARTHMERMCSVTIECVLLLCLHELQVYMHLYIHTHMCT